MICCHSLYAHGPPLARSCNEHPRDPPTHMSAPSPWAPHRQVLLSVPSPAACLPGVVLQGIGPQVLADDLGGQTGQGRSHIPIPGTCGTHRGHLWYLPVRPHLSNPAGSRKVVAREPVEEVKAAVVVPAAVGLTFIILVPLNWSGMRLPVPCRKRSV